MFFANRVVWIKLYPNQPTSQPSSATNKSKDSKEQKPNQIIEESSSASYVVGLIVNVSMW
jgi:hypothetical protein